ncbi:Dimeric alpha-beta barrel [Fusarium acuminatum]|uniref:Dimeric alpha-beta barrel n=1 Tax=Fusarium acuminatum TaxID=5515 RepID=A0ABZ2X400_9HYPO
MITTVIIQYPTGHDFNVDYYVNTHMPLAEKTWGSHGLISAEVVKLGGDSPHQIYTIMKWESLAAFQKAGAMEETKAVHEDVKNFTTAKPTMVIGETVASPKL